MTPAIPKPNRKAERRQKRENRSLARRTFAEEVFRLDNYRCINVDCPHSKYRHTSGLHPHHGLKKRPHNRELDSPKWGASLCAQPGGCHTKAEDGDGNLPAMLWMIYVLQARRNSGLPFRHAELLAELEKKVKP